jgi:hypothetical protein
MMGFLLNSKNPFKKKHKKKPVGATTHPTGSWINLEISF